MKRIVLVLALVLTLSTSLGAAATTWSTPTPLMGSDAAFWPSISDDGSTAIWLKLTGLSGNDASGLSIMGTQLVKGKWQPAVTLATNGVKQGIPLAETRPVISGDGKTVVYMGLDAAKNEHRLYEVVKNKNGTWGKPAIIASVPTGTFGDTISIDKTGKTVAFLMGDGGFLGGTSVLNVIEKMDGAWQEPQKLTASGYVGGADDPMLSSDGKTLVYLQANAIFDVIVVQKKDGLWQEPTPLVKSKEEKSLTSISGDGRTVFYYRSSLKDSVILGYDLFAIKQSGTAWGKPVKLNSALMPATLMYDQGVSSSEDGTRAVFANFIKKGDAISASAISYVDFAKGVWSKPVTAVKDTWGMQIFPQVSSNGKIIYFVNYQLQVVTGK